MSRYHINDNGIGICQAQYKCPFGGEENHFPDKISAQAAFEERMSGDNFSTISKVKIPTYITSPEFMNKKKAWDKLVEEHGLRNLHSTGFLYPNEKALEEKTKLKEALGSTFAKPDDEILGIVYEELNNTIYLRRGDEWSEYHT